MLVSVDADQDASLTAMWHAFRATRLSAQKLVVTDASVVEALLNSRYYNGSQGQFLSEDPIFLGTQQNLQNPQSLNTYSYSGDNPITQSDPAGRQCVACAGGEVALSLSAQATYDGVFGPSSSAVYGGDVVAASIYGFAYPWTLVAPEPIAAVSAAAGNVAQQGLEYLNGDGNSFDPSQVETSATVAFGTQLALGELPLPFIATSPLTKQLATKLGKGTISNVSNAALTNVMVSGAPADFIGNLTTSYVQTQTGNSHVNTSESFQAGLSTAMSSASPSLSLTIQLAQAAISLAKAVIAADSGDCGQVFRLIADTDSD